MIATLALVAATVWTSPTVDAEIHGRATYMNPGRMQETLRNRGIEVPPGFIPVALNRKGDLGRKVWVQWPPDDDHPQGQINQALVVDCAQAQHFNARERQRLIVEVSAEVAGEHDFYLLGPMGGVTVLFANPWPEPPEMT